MKLFRLILVVALMVSHGVAMAADPFLGRWSLDEKRSKYAAGSCPKQMTIEMNQADHGIHYHSETVWLNGKTTSSDYTADYDSQPVIVVGTKGVMLPVAVKRIAPNEALATYTRGMQTVAVSRRFVSTDGQIMTLTTTTWDESGNAITNVGVFRKLDEKAEGSKREVVAKDGSTVSPGQKTSANRL